MWVVRALRPYHSLRLSPARLGLLLDPRCESDFRHSLSCCPRILIELLRIRYACCPWIRLSGCLRKYICRMEKKYSPWQVVSAMRILPPFSAQDKRGLYLLDSLEFLLMFSPNSPPCFVLNHWVIHQLGGFWCSFLPPFVTSFLFYDCFLFGVKKNALWDLLGTSEWTCSLGEEITLVEGMVHLLCVGSGNRQTGKGCLRLFRMLPEVDVSAEVSQNCALPWSSTRGCM